MSTKKESSFRRCASPARGELNETLIAILRANVRQPLLVEGDLYSLVACNERGCRRLREMMHEFGQHDLTALAGWILDTSREAMIRAIAKLRPGTYSHRTQIDGFESSFTLCAALTLGPEAYWSILRALHRHAVAV